MTRLFLAASVAALAIAAPTIAGPRDQDGNTTAQEKKRAEPPEKKQAQERKQGGGEQRVLVPQPSRPDVVARQMERQTVASPPIERKQHVQTPVAEQQQARPNRQQVQARNMQQQQLRVERQQQTHAPIAEQQQRASHQQQVQTRLAQQQQGNRTEQARPLRPHGRQEAQTRIVQQQQLRANRQEAQTRVTQQKQLRANRQEAQTRVAQQQQLRANHQEAQTRVAQQQQLRANRQEAQTRMAQQQQLGVNRQQPMQSQIPQRQQVAAQIARRQQPQENPVPGNVNTPVAANNTGLTIVRQQQVQALRTADPQIFQASRIQMLAPRTQIVPPNQVVQYIGQPVSTVTNYVPLAALPQSVSYLYPDTPDYYYQYGGGYLYQVDRGTNLIAALVPLLAGGYLPGSYLPSSYMSSYVPDYYGLNSFYPSSYGPEYGYDGYDPYGNANICNRYANGVIYQVDCETGIVENVIPIYSGGYGVGQMLPSAYSYYNVPMQYRTMYYPTSDYSYWYAPGAIYQYDPQTSLITSVAALMSPGFTVGQPLPVGYDMYNVPMAYRSTYYDTSTAWYRYNNGYIYQIDPATQLVTSIVASLFA